MNLNYFEFEDSIPGGDALRSNEDVISHLAKRFYEGCVTSVRTSIEKNTVQLQAWVGREMPSEEHGKTLIKFAKLYLEEIGYTKKDMPKFKVKFGDDDGYYTLRKGRSTIEFIKVA